MTDLDKQIKRHMDSIGPHYDVKVCGCGYLCVPGTDFCGECGKAQANKDGDPVREHLGRGR